MHILARIFARERIIIRKKNGWGPWVHYIVILYYVILCYNNKATVWVIGIGGAHGPMGPRPHGPMGLDRSRIDPGSIPDRTMIGPYSIQARSRIDSGSIPDRSRIDPGSLPLPSWFPPGSLLAPSCIPTSLERRAAQERASRASQH